MARSSNTPKMIALKNGAVVPADTLDQVLEALHGLQQSDPIALYEATTKARDPWGFPRFGRLALAGLKRANLVDTRGELLPYVPDIIVCAVQGESLGMWVVSPVDGDQLGTMPTPNDSEPRLTDEFFDSLGVGTAPPDSPIYQHGSILIVEPGPASPSPVPAVDQPPASPRSARSSRQGKAR